MIFERLPEPIDALVIKNTFNDDVIDEVMHEVKSITHNDMLNGAVWLNDLYKDLAISAIHTNTMKAYFNDDTIDHLLSVNSFYGIYTFVNNHSTSVQHYGDLQSSILHYDAAVFTAFTFMYDEPRNFSGGDLTLQIGGEVAYEQPIENNMTVIFPSSYYVGISDILIENKDIQNSGLYVITSYMFVEPR